MTFKLKKPVASNMAVDEHDIRNLKVVLNRLGYYMPPKDIGIVGTPDRGVFDALKNFQKDHGLRESGAMRPGDKSEQKIRDMFQALPEAGVKYIWRTVGDNKVRASHAALEGEIRTFGEGLDPGDDPGCRCSAELVVKRDCKEEEIAYAEAVEKFEKLDQRKREIEKKIEEIRQELLNIEESIKNIWVITGVSSLLPRISGEITGNIVQDEANNAQKELSIKKKRLNAQLQHFEGELQLIIPKLNKAADEVLQRLRELEECRKRFSH